MCDCMLYCPCTHLRFEVITKTLLLSCISSKREIKKAHLLILTDDVTQRILIVYINRGATRNFQGQGKYIGIKTF